MQNILFAPALWMPAALAFIALGLFWFGNSRTRPSIRNAGVGLLALTLVWAAVAWFVQTPVEKCVTRTRAVIAAVENGKWDELRTLLDETTTLEFLRGPEAIAGATESAASAYGLTNITLFGTDAVEGIGSVDVNFTAILEGSRPAKSSWKFEYLVRPDGIVLSRIQPISIGNSSIDQIRRAIGNGR